MDLDAFNELLTPRGQRALAEAEGLTGSDPVAAATRLRKTYDAALTSAALTQAGLRERAKAKFGADAALMYFTPHGLEQSTRTEVAEHRAQRLADHRAAQRADLGPGQPAEQHPEPQAAHHTAPQAEQLTAPQADRPAGQHPEPPATHHAAPLADRLATPQAERPAAPQAERLAAPQAEPPAGRHADHLAGARAVHRPTSQAEHRGGSLDVHRAGRLGGMRVLDVCCGIGGDFLGLARAGCVVEAVDLDPVTVAVARANAEALGVADRVTVRVGDAAEVRPEGYDVLFADPARRSGRGRTFDPLAYSPPWPVVLDLVARAERACLKVAPGIPYEFIPEHAEAEWVSYKGEVKEATLWMGWDTGVSRRATLLPAGHTLTATGVEAPVGPVGRYVYEPDGAAIRAHLVGEVTEMINGRLPDPMIAYITADELFDTPWAARYEVDEVLPFSLKRLRAALRERRIGNVTIKKRGSAIDIERLRADLRLSGEKSTVIILTRILDKPSVIICNPFPPA